MSEQQEFYTLDDVSKCSPSLINDDLRPTRLEERTWSRWHIASLWVGMSVCIPTYILASNMITGGLTWLETVIIILLGNLIVAIPMTLNGHAGTKYGIPFPVLGRATFGVAGVHIPSLIRALVACAWFGIQTWVGGLAIASICGVLFGDSSLSQSFSVQLVGFSLFWAIQMVFVWRGTESIKWLEAFAAPLLIIFGLFMLGWGINKGGGISQVLSASQQFAQPTLSVSATQDTASAKLNLIRNQTGEVRATLYRGVVSSAQADVAKAELKKLDFLPLDPKVAQGEGALSFTLPPAETQTSKQGEAQGEASAAPALMLYVQLGASGADAKMIESEVTSAKISTASAKNAPEGGGSKWITYLLWLTGMVSFWATLALNISDITRYAQSQRDQVVGQFLGLPTTMTLYSFIGVAVTCAAVMIFDQILITQDAPWEPATLINYFSDQPLLILFAQVMILIATLSTNIAANIISPANSFANLAPRKISFRAGGMIAGVLGLFTMPWLLSGQIAGFLMAYGSVLGPVVAVLIADYYFVHQKNLKLEDLYLERGAYTYQGGYHRAAFISLIVGIAAVFVSSMFKELELIYKTGWFSGFLISFMLYLLLANKRSA